MLRGLLGSVALLVLIAVGTHAQAGDASVLLDANTAAESDLLPLPHITPVLAKAIVGRRPFKSVRDLDALLQPLSRQQRVELYGRLFVPINLNTATDAEILTIPGVGQRMLREFKEYRPYTSMAQFRREIGKYVSRQEVARLERYVVLNSRKS
jgi:DNA uptake protein ComE-like DNA-binding protein